MKIWMWVVIAVLVVLAIVLIVRAVRKSRAEKSQLEVVKTEMETTNMASLVSYIGNMFSGNQESEGDTWASLTDEQQEALEDEALANAGEGEIVWN